MKVEVLYFARLKEIAGTAAETVELPSGATVSELLERLRRGRAPDWAGTFRTAVNEEFSDGGRVLEDGDAVALLPPVSGG